MAANNIDLLSFAMTRIRKPDSQTQSVYGGKTIGILGEIAKGLVSIDGLQSVHSITPVVLLKYTCDGLRLHGYVPEKATFGRSLS